MVNWILFLILLIGFTTIITLWINDHGDIREDRVIMTEQEYQP